MDRLALRRPLGPFFLAIAVELPPYVRLGRISLSSEPDGIPIPSRRSSVQGEDGARTGGRIAREAQPSTGTRRALEAEQDRWRAHAIRLQNRRIRLGRLETRLFSLDSTHPMSAEEALLCKMVPVVGFLMFVSGLCLVAIPGNGAGRESQSASSNVTSSLEGSEDGHQPARSDVAEGIAGLLVLFGGLMAFCGAIVQPEASRRDQNRVDRARRPALESECARLSSSVAEDEATLLDIDERIPLLEEAHLLEAWLLPELVPFVQSYAHDDPAALPAQLPPVGVGTVLPD